MSRPIRVLVVDDSALARQIITAGLKQDPRIEVVGHAPDVYVARDKIVALEPDVLTLDVEMPRMDGVQFLKRLMPQHPMPVVVVSALTKEGAAITIDALQSGAVDFVPKPSSSFGNRLESMMSELADKVVMAAQTDVSKWRQSDFKIDAVKHTQKSLQESSDKVIAIGASTGGTVALTGIVQKLSPTIPGVVIVQHMPPVFTQMFADKLNQISAVEVKEAADGDRILTGRVLIAPGGMHLTVSRSGGRYLVHCKPGEPVSGHCPSVDVLMRSVAENAGANAVGAILTGMGSDGAEGLKQMREAGARTIAQDAESCVVFGMPKQAYQNGGAERLIALDKVARTITELSQEIGA